MSLLGCLAELCTSQPEGVSRAQLVATCFVCVCRQTAMPVTILDTLRPNPKCRVFGFHLAVQLNTCAQQLSLRVCTGRFTTGVNKANFVDPSA